MKMIREDIDRILIFGLLLVVIIFSLLMFNSALGFKKHINDKTSKIKKSKFTEQQLIKAQKKAKEDMAVMINNDFIEFVSFLSGRNIFTKVKDAQQPKAEIEYNNESGFEISYIMREPLNIEYRGRIVYGPGKIVAQVNLRNKTFLVRQGSKFAGYTVKYLDMHKIFLKKEDGSELEIGYREVVYKNKLTAQIKELETERSFFITKGSTFYGYKVLDIQEDYVLLSKHGQHLKLEKGMVHK